MAARAVAHRINAGHTDHVGPTGPCRCGNTAHSAGRKEKTILTAMGEMRLERAYYHCDACRSGFCPRDRVLGVEGASLSPAVTRMVGTVAAMVSFAEGGELLGDLAGLTVNAKQVERTAEALSIETAEDAEIAPTMYLGYGWNGCADAQRGVGRQAGQAGGRFFKDA
ncbi:MAG: hypothetical protein A3H39_12170 [candidate division NC10 bacterium RIFCSPLOWO2_02_FULL_66_22]|nr:MAG: hypothetical protein A3H39_12170 [candidate division NC10 bacterium RIFCSPLOWO2_02_FULL_66_22]